MKNIILTMFGVIILLFCHNCAESPVIEKEPGNLHFSITSLDKYNQPIPCEGVEITTTPVTKTIKTDEFGSAILRNLKPKTYEIYLHKKRYKPVKKAIPIKWGDNYELDINLGKASTTNETDIVVRSPQEQARFSPGEKVSFDIQAIPEKPAQGLLYIEIISDKEGLLYEGYLEKYSMFYETSTLSPDEHNITITISDKIGYEAHKEMTIHTNCPDPIEIKDVIFNKGTTTVSWQESDSKDFLRYDLFCSKDTLSTSEKIASISAADNTSFSYKIEFPIQELYYWVKVINKAESYRESKKFHRKYPAGYMLEGGLDDAIHHPTEPIIYTSTNSLQGSQISRITYDVSISSLSTSHFKMQSGKLAVADNGFGIELYVPSSNGSVYALHGDDLSINKEIPVASSILSVATHGNGTFVAVNKGSWNAVSSIDRKSGNKISSKGNYSPIIQAIPNSTDMIGISSNGNPKQMNYYIIDENGTIEKEINDPYYNDYPLDGDIFSIAPNGEYLITSKAGTLYRADKNMTFINNIKDEQTGNYIDFCFSPDASLIYGAIHNEKIIEIIQYPDLLIQDKKIQTKGYPSKIFLRKDQLIVIYAIHNTYEEFGIEIIELRKKNKL